MSNIYLTQSSFYYDPIRQGYDTAQWKTLGGSVSAYGGGGLVATNGEAIGLGDILRGDIIFEVIVPTAPSSGGYREFGLWSPSKNAELLFNIHSGSFSVSASDGVVTSTESIDWDSDWTANRVVFKIRWDAGMVKFYINGVRRAILTGDAIPYGPLSLYFSDASDSDQMIVKMITVLGTYGYTSRAASSDSGLYGPVYLRASDVVDASDSPSASVV